MLKAEVYRRTAVRGLFALTIAAVAPVIVLAAGQSAFAAGPDWPNEVSARYRLFFNGLDVGTYDFKSRVNGKSYSAVGTTKITALFGAFKWTGHFAGSGSIDHGVPHPASFEMSYKSRSKTHSVKLGFDGDRISTVAVEPKKRLGKNAIPLKPEDFKHVFDPIAATLAVSSAASRSACDRTIPVFDGKIRFDLKLTLKGHEQVKEKHAKGEPADLVVCRVKYVPIAGHKPKDFVHPWIDYDNIEIALRAVPRAGIYVPYRVTVPSTLGSAVMDAERINITAADDTQIALRR
jgi:hypothetical protein